MAPLNIKSQVSFKSFEAMHIIFPNRTVNLIKSDEVRVIIQHLLDQRRLRIVLYPYSSCWNNYDSYTQLVYVTVPTNSTSRVKFLHYEYYISKLIVSSVLGGETYDFADGIDAAYILRFDLKKLVQERIPLTILTYSSPMFKVIVKSSVTTEKHLMIYIRAAPEAYEPRDICNIDWIRSHENVADAMTKYAKFKAFVQLLDTGTLITFRDQWVIRKVVGSDGLDDQLKNDRQEEGIGSGSVSPFE